MENTRKPYSFLFLAALAACLVAGAVSVHGGEKEPRLPSWVETDVDRPGSDFRILWLRGGLEACQEACAQNPLCTSYTFVKEGDPGRIGGCWLKDSVPPPVRDACCVSGVKTGETVSRYLTKPEPFPQEAEIPPSPPQARTDVPQPMDREPEPEEEKEPETGSGERRRAGLDYSATPSLLVPERTRDGKRATVAPPPADVGTGRRRAKGMDFAAVPPGTTAVRGSETAPLDRRDTGAGRRGIRGVLYAAVPPPGGMTDAEGHRFGTVIREVIGVDITAVPPDRNRGEAK